MGLYSCKDPDDFDIYARPDWLVGNTFSKILEQPELSTFAECIVLTGYDSIIMYPEVILLLHPQIRHLTTGWVKISTVQ